MASRIDAALMNDIVGWDVRTWSKAVEFWDAQVAAAPPALRCLEIGAGPGGPSLWLALKGHEVVCSNNLTAEHRASPLHRRHGVYERIEHRDIDATAIPHREEFDIVVFKSVLGGVDPEGFVSQRTAIDAMHAALKPGGRLLFAENLLATPLHGSPGEWRGARAKVAGDSPPMASSPPCCRDSRGWSCTRRESQQCSA